MGDRPYTAMRYRPGKWAKWSTVIAGAGYIANIWWAAHYGVDTSLAAFIHLFTIFFLAVLPMIFGKIFYGGSGHSQRAGDRAFAICMIAQGIILAVAPAV